MTGDSQAADAAADQHGSEQGRAVATVARRNSSLPIGRRKAQLAPETLRLYAADWALFSEYCADAGASALPAQPTTVAAFLTQGGPARAARTRRLAAIDHRHRQHDFPCPGDDAAVRRALKQARAVTPRRPRPVPPASVALGNMALRCPRDLAGLRDRALLLLLGLGLSRCELVGVQAERLRWAEDGIRMEGATVWAPRSPRHDLCPVRALEDWLRAAGTRYGPVFRKVTRWGTVEPKALGADAIRLVLARRAG